MDQLGGCVGSDRPTGRSSNSPDRSLQLSGFTLFVETLLRAITQRMTIAGVTGVAQESRMRAPVRAILSSEERSTCDRIPKAFPL